MDYESLNREIVGCDRCPRLRGWCDEVARVKRKGFAEWEYWGKPVPNFGDPLANGLIVGLAPAAHGANRTGRMFTGDRSGDWLYRALYRAGLASQAESESAADGLVLRGCLITASCHCAPPGNKPLPDELAACRGWLRSTWELREWRAVLCLGGIAWGEVGRLLGLKLPKFGHGVEVVFGGTSPPNPLSTYAETSPPSPLSTYAETSPPNPLSTYAEWGSLVLIGSYHPSQQNTFTGRLTEEMLDSVVGRFGELCL
jgi:uracil-DNA glycosylase family 4